MTDRRPNHRSQALSRLTRPGRSGWVLALATVVAIAFLAAGCSTVATTAGGASATIGNEGTPVDGGDLVVAVDNDTSGWNPHDNQWAQAGSMVGSSVLEPLATTDADLDAAPWLAESWTPNATFDSYTIVLRTGVTFQNGQPLDAVALKLNIDDASTAGLSGVAIKGLIDQVTVVDDHTVRVDLAQPWAAFPSSFLNGQSAMMMAPAMLSSATRGSDHPIGTGPYTFVSWQPGATFKAIKNVSYWQAGLPHLDGIEFQVLADGSAQAAALRSGDVNLLFTSRPSSANTLASQYTVIKDWGSEPGMAMTNTIPIVKGSPNPMSNQHARLALAYATDREALASAAGDGVQSPSSPFPRPANGGCLMTRTATCRSTSTRPRPRLRSTSRTRERRRSRSSFRLPPESTWPGSPSSCRASGTRRDVARRSLAQPLSILGHDHPGSRPVRAGDPLLPFIPVAFVGVRMMETIGLNLSPNAERQRRTIWPPSTAMI